MVGKIAQIQSSGGGIDRNNVCLYNGRRTYIYRGCRSVVSLATRFSETVHSRHYTQDMQVVDYQHQMNGTWSRTSLNPFATKRRLVVPLIAPLFIWLPGLNYTTEAYRRPMFRSMQGFITRVRDKQLLEKVESAVWKSCRFVMLYR